MMIQQTSVQQFYQYKEFGNLQKHQDEVFEALLNVGEMCDRQIANHTGLPINIVTGRRNGLYKNGTLVNYNGVWYEIYNAGVNLDENDRSVLFWGVREQKIL